MMDTKISIIGAGVVGLAIASKISKIADSVFVLEKNLSALAIPHAEVADINQYSLRYWSTLRSIVY